MTTSLTDKLKIARDAVLAAENALRDAGLPYSAQAIRDLLPSVDVELNNKLAWLEDFRRPYYGG